MGKKKLISHASMWIFSGVILAALNIAIWNESSAATPAIGGAGSPGFWAGSILLIIALCVIDLAWVGLFVLWLAKRKAGIPEGDTLIQPPSEHPEDGPELEQKKAED